MPSTRSTSAQSEALTRTFMTAHGLYETYIVPRLPVPLQHVSNQASDLLYQAYPYLSQAIALITSFLSSSDSSLLSLGILLITLYIGLRIANYIRRTILGWVWLGIKLVLFLVLVQVAIYVNNYGLERAVRDASWAGGLIWGLLEDAMEGNDPQFQQQGGRRIPRGMRSRYDGKQRTQGRGGRWS